MALRFSKTRIFSLILMTLLGITMFAAVAVAAGSATIEVTVKNASWTASTAVIPGDLSPGLAVVNANGTTLIEGDDYEFDHTTDTNVYTITGLTTKGDYFVSLGDGYITETIKVAGVSPTTGVSKKSVNMAWSPITDKKVGAIGGVIYAADGTVAANSKIKIINSPTATSSWTTASTTNGAFKVLLPAGKYSLIVYGKDSLYHDNLYDLTVQAGQMASPLDPMTNENLWSANDVDPVLTVSSTPAPVFGKDVKITFTNGKLMTDARTTVFITTSSSITTTGAGITLPLSKSLYKLTTNASTGAGNIVIKAAAFDVGTYVINLSNGAYNVAKSTVSDVVIGAATTNAPALTATALKTDVVGETQLTVTPALGNSIYYKSSATTIATADIPKLGAKITTSSALKLDVSKKITGLNLVNRKYLVLYELTPSNAVAKFKVITLTNTMVKTDTAAPILSTSSTYVPLSVNETKKIIRLTFDKNIYQAGTDTAFKAAIKVLLNSTTTTSTAIGTYDSSASVAVSGKTVTITLSGKTLLEGNKISIAANALQNAYAVKNAALTSAAFSSTTPTSTTASALTLTDFTWAAGTATGTTQAISVPTGTLKYVVGAAGAQTAPNIGDLATAYPNTLTANTDIAVTSGQHIFIVEVDSLSSNKIVQWNYIIPTPGNIKQ